MTKTKDNCTCTDIEKVKLVVFGNGDEGLAKRVRRMEKQLWVLLFLVAILLLKEGGTTILKLLSMI